MNAPLRVLSAAVPRVVPPTPPTASTPNPRLYSASWHLPSSLQGPVAMTAESTPSLPSLAVHCIGANKKAFTQLIKRHHNAVRNAQFTHLVRSTAPLPPSLISFRVNLCDSYCVDFSSIHRLYYDPFSRLQLNVLIFLFNSLP